MDNLPVNVVTFLIFIVYLSSIVEEVEPLRIYRNKLCQFILSTFTNTYHIREESDESNNPEPVPVPIQVPIKYEDKYNDRYHALESHPISKETLDGLKNSILLENTPLGNVLMFYNNERETFTFYADSSIPYRFLETIARKYVIINNCKSIYVDMTDELDGAKKKKDDKDNQVTETVRNNAHMLSENTTNNSSNSTSSTKKSVFAKLKTYNTDSSKASSSSSSTGAFDKERAQLVKERSNRYSYEGKLMNYSFLKKVDRKKVDKTYALTFAEFKQMMSTTEGK